MSKPFCKWLSCYHVFDQIQGKLGIKLEFSIMFSGLTKVCQQNKCMIHLAQPDKTPGPASVTSSQNKRLLSWHSLPV